MLTELTLVQAARCLHRGDVTAEAYAGALLDRCVEQAGLGAFIAQDGDAVLDAARAADRQRRAGQRLGRLHGIPLAIKDNINTAGLPTTGGTAALRALRPGADAPVVSRLRAEGALVLGKTNLHELSMGWTGNNPHFGPARNPYDPRHIAGGSSGGTAVAVAAGLAPAGLGTDTNGSLRVPAALCGTASLRPTVGRYPSAGLVPLSRTLDTVGPMARTVADLALLDSVLAAQPEARPRHDLTGVRIGTVPDYFFSALPPEIAAASADVLDRLRRAGAEICPIALPELDDLLPRISLSLIYYEAARLLPSYLAAFAPGVSLRHVADAAGPDVRHLIETLLLPDGGQRIDDERYRQALTARAQLQALLRRGFRDNGLAVIAFPATRTAAPPIAPQFVSPAPDVDGPGGRLSARDAFGKNIAPAAAAGLPGLVLPAALSRDGLPIGFEFDAAPGDDEALLGLGFALEAALGPLPPPGPAHRSARTAACTEQPTQTADV